MTAEDLCAPEPKREANPRRFNQPTMSQLSKPTFTNSHVMVLSMLSEMRVRYLAEHTFLRFNEYSDGGQMKTWTVDVLIVDPRYWAGVIEVNGSVHHTKNGPARDAKKADFLRKLGLWVEPLENQAVNSESLTAILARHERRLDDYGNPY